MLRLDLGGGALRGDAGFRRPPLRRAPARDTFFLCARHARLAAPESCGARACSGCASTRTRRWSCSTASPRSSGSGCFPNLRLRNATDGVFPLAAGYRVRVAVLLHRSQAAGQLPLADRHAGQRRLRDVADAIRLPEAVVRRLDERWLVEPLAGGAPRSDAGRVALDDAPEVRARGSVPKARPHRRRGARRRRRRRPPGRRSAPAASPGGPAPSARPRAGRGPRSPRGRSELVAQLAPRRRRGAARRRSPRSTSAKNASTRLGAARHRAQHVEALHVARALPDRGQRALAEQAGHAGLLDVTVAAQALQRLDRVDRGRACRSST